MSTYELAWSVGRQTFSARGEVFTNEGDPGTSVGHDFCHLVIAAHRSLPWRPAGRDRSIRLAEHNAVLLEWIYHAVLVRLARGDCGEALARGVLDEAEEHARDFVERHYAPFPVTFATARTRFYRAIRPELVARLLPVYVDAQRMNELVRRAPFPMARIRFDDGAAPAWDSPGQRELAAALRSRVTRAR